MNGNAKQRVEGVGGGRQRAGRLLGVAAVAEALQSFCGGGVLRVGGGEDGYGEGERGCEQCL